MHTFVQWNRCREDKLGGPKPLPAQSGAKSPRTQDPWAKHTHVHMRTIHTFNTHACAHVRKKHPKLKQSQSQITDRGHETSPNPTREGAFCGPSLILLSFVCCLSACARAWVLCTCVVFIVCMLVLSNTFMHAYIHRNHAYIHAYTTCIARMHA